jgi:transcription termination factor NusB
MIKELETKIDSTIAETTRNKLAKVFENILRSASKFMVNTSSTPCGLFNVHYAIMYNSVFTYYSKIKP